MIEKEAVIVAWLPTAETNSDKTLKMWRSNPELTKCSTIRIINLDEVATCKIKHKPKKLLTIRY